ncbi:hypothetical protein [Tenacibaculum amylolyticum]|uniref:hypothetical protein n=1 Tax=Tenacibaculum amylolyticum TaxID=104269 RepID=UPI00389402F1
MKKLIISAAIALGLLKGYGQELPQIIPLSPNAAEMTKYGEIPVGHFTGVPNIGIPIYTISSGDLKLPLSLSYHAGGNKVESIASWVGLGWSLNTIPSISRSVRGIPDENGGYFSKYSGKTIKEIWDEKDSNSTFFNLYRQDLFNGIKDSEPDIFNYNIPGESGKFFWNQETASFITFPKSNIQITKEGSGFTLVDQNGVTYIMNSKETNTPNGGSAKTTSWYISKMIAANKKDTIDFIYRTESQIIKTTNVVTKYHVLGGLGHIPPNEGSILITSRTDAKLIDKIVFSTGYVKFSEDTEPREDLLGGHRLKNIAIYTNNNELIKNYQLHHRYKSGSGNSLGNCYNAESYVKKWMLFDTLEEVSNIDIDKKLTHNFTYNEHNFPACRRSAGQDYWGYYNGHDENANLTPTYSIPTLGTPIVIQGADRSVNPNASQFGILTKITYPTGGFTEFNYENHDVRNDGIIPPQYIKSSQTLEVLEFIDIEEPLTPTFTATKQFTINNPPDTRLNGNNPNGGAIVKFTIVEPGCDLSNGLANNCARFTVEGSNGIIDITYPEKTFHLPNGTYNMVVRFNQNPPQYRYAAFIAEWEKAIVNQTSTNKYAGGLRIKEMKNYTHENATPIVKEYKYTKSLDSNDSSGNTFMTPNFSHTLKIYYHAGVPSGGQSETQLLRVQSTSNMQQVTHSGSPVGYSKVFEIQKGTTKNLGYTEYNYSHVKDEGDHTFPYVPAESMELDRGQLLKRFVYKDEEGINNAKLVEKKSYNYSQHSFRTTNAYPKSSFAIKWGNDIIGDHNKHGLKYAQNMTPYYTNSGWNSLSNESHQTFFENSTITSHVSYAHENPIHLLRTKQETISSDNKTLTTTFMYPQDIGSPNVAEQQLIVQNRIAIPIQTITENKTSNGDLLSNAKQKIIYKDWGNDIILPEKNQTSKGASSLEDRIIFHSYDSKGNPIEVSKHDGIHISYIWGYDQQYPVAKIENATRAQIEALPGFNSNFHTETGGLTALQEQTLRTSLPNAMITTYTYNPLVGITSMTDPREYTIYYHYDDFNRLKSIKDAAGNITEEYKYNYKN